MVPVRAEELLLPGHAEELPDLAVRRAAVHRRVPRRRWSTARRSGSASSGCTWRRTPARRRTSAGRPAASTGPSTRSSTTTGPASRWSRSSPSRCPAPATWPPRSPRRTSPSSATCSARSGVSDVRMEQGSLRCDVNTSLSVRGSGVWGTRTETKNVNSLRSVERAVRSEIERQAFVLDSGDRIIQETRHFHEDTGVTTLRPVARKRRTTTATSPSPTWCRSRRTRPGWRRSARRCPSCRPPAGPG